MDTFKLNMFNRQSHHNLTSGEILVKRILETQQAFTSLTLIETIVW